MNAQETTLNASEHEPIPEPDLYEELVKNQGQPFAASTRAVSLNEPFFVSKFAMEHLVLYEPNEQTFYGYEESRGLWQPLTAATVKELFSKDIKSFADAQGEERIERKRNSRLLTGLMDQLKGQVQRANVFIRDDGRIHLKNGMLHLNVNPPELWEFSPDYYSRNQCPIEIVRGARCPRFKKEFLEIALDKDDIWLLQRYCGSLLIGGNRAQRLLIVHGLGGGGKSTLAELLEKIIGLENVTELRTEYLAERFELYRFVGKTLLTGKDVPPDFLMRKGAPVLKKLVGHDLLTPEGKNSNRAVNFRGDFGVIITANTKLKVKVEGDHEAWRRRLLVIEYKRTKPKIPIPNFADLLLKEEGPGILNWMIQGALAHLLELRERGGFVLTETQKERIESLLAESDSVREFVRTCIKPAHAAERVATEELVLAYQRFCINRNWQPEPATVVEKRLPDLIKEFYSITPRHDIKVFGSLHRGYGGLQIPPDHEP
jgi:P4 family phage/plasmid primase-like protien